MLKSTPELSLAKYGLFSSTVIFIKLDVSNAAVQIFFTLAGRTISLRFEQPVNVPEGIYVILLSGMYE